MGEDKAKFFSEYQRAYFPIHGTDNYAEIKMATGWSPFS